MACVISDEVRRCAGSRIPSSSIPTGRSRSAVWRWRPARCDEVHAIDGLNMLSPEIQK
jgi:hypothetical protein